MRDTFVRTLVELAKEDKSIELVTGDLGFGVLKPFWEQCPDQFTNAGIAEQNMTSMAAGMALEGKNVFTYSIGNFPTLRCLEQIRNDCAYHQANVKIVCIGGGFVYGSLGMSHQATEDLAILRALPDVVVMAPADLVEAEECTKALAKYKGTAYLRLGRGGEKRIHEKIENFRIGKAIKVHDGERVALFSTGAIFEEVTSAYEKLVEAGYSPAVYTFPTVKPIDKKIIEETAENFELIVTVEEHNIVGGFGSAVAEVMAEMREKKAALLRIGLNDEYSVRVGNQKYLRAQYGMSKEALEKLKQFCYAANKSTGSSHPCDEARWFDFICQTVEDNKTLDYDTLYRFLMDDEYWGEKKTEFHGCMGHFAWDERHAAELASEYDNYVRILKYYKEKKWNKAYEAAQK